MVLGATDNAIAHRVQTGRLYRVHPGVYSVGRAPGTPLERATAAVLACGPQAVLSHSSALALWNLARWSRRFEITVTRGDPRPRGMTVHRATTLARRDLTTQLGIRTTDPARTLLDCAPRLSDPALARAVNDARHARLTSPRALAELLARYPTHPGARRLAPFAETTGPPSDSPFEDRFLALCERFALPTPQFQATVCGFRVDALFAAERLIVECDGWDFHRDRTAFITDRERDATTLEAGYATVRITWERPDEQEAARLHRILAQRRSG